MAYSDAVLATLFSLRGNRPSRKKENSLITREREKGDDGKGSGMPRGVTEASLLALIRVYEKEVGSSRIARRIVFHDRNRSIAHGARRRTSESALRRRRSAEFTERGRAAIAVERRLSARIARAPDNNERADIPSLGGGLLRHLDMHSGAVRAGDAQDEARSRSARSLAPATRHSRRLSATITQSCRIRDPWSRAFFEFAGKVGRYVTTRNSSVYLSQMPIELGFGLLSRSCVPHFSPCQGTSRRHELQPY